MPGKPFTAEDDEFILMALAEGDGYCALARALGRSASSVKGRADRLRGVGRYERAPEAPEFESVERACARCGKAFETTPTRRLLCATCYKGAGGGIDI